MSLIKPIAGVRPSPGRTPASSRDDAEVPAEAHGCAGPSRRRNATAWQSGTKGREPGEIERDAVLASVKGALRAPLRGAAHP